jgi:hypothetical protein
MNKNVVLKSAISTVLALPRKALWTATVAVAALALESGVGIVGDQFSWNLGTAKAGEGSFSDDNGTDDLLTSPAAPAFTIASFLPAITATTTPTRVVGKVVTAPAVPVASGGDYPVVYASEIFGSGTPTTGLPSGVDSYHVAKYVLSGLISKNFTVTFTLAGASFNAAHLGIRNPTAATVCGAGITPGTTGSFTIDVAACVVEDGSELYLLYKLTGVSQTTPEVIMTASFKGTTAAEIPNPSRTLPVVKLTSGINVSIEPEVGGFTYVSSASDNLEFISTDTTGTSKAYQSPDEVQIGYLKLISKEAVKDDGNTAYSFGGPAVTDATGKVLEDTAVLTITNGQFAASPGGGVASGKVYLYAGTPIDAVSPTEATTATWNLSGIQLGTMSSWVNDPLKPSEKGVVPIRIKANGLTEINDVDADPEASITVTLGSTPTAKPITATGTLLRIPRDGKTCWIHNVPAPDALDAMTIRITNNAVTASAKIVGTLYHEDGTSDDLTSVTLVEEIAPGATVVLTSDDIKTLGGGSVTWNPAERRVLKLTSSIPTIEVFNLLRGRGAKQPMTNVSTGARGVDCIPRN